ncbi:Pectin lyase fold/virulence factor [Sesbania bispinosa]|nr:Pectin lyase fold/virulence factor [Sesbania bispinosa]
MCAKYLFVLCLLFWVAKAQLKIKVFKVKDYGAIADGKTDNSVAFLKAWNEACKWDGKAIVLIPKGTYMLKEVIFNGPCHGWTNFKIKGVLKAPPDPSSYTTDNWINFRYVNQLIVSGHGHLDGQGSSAWAHNDCHKNPNCHSLPTTMRFDFITNGYVHHLHSIDSKHNHFVIFGCENMRLKKLALSAPADSPNTDGIKIGESNGINITSVKIGTGDDCISILSGTRKVRISDVLCGPGHGISVGSLGEYGGEKDVQDIVVKNCTFIGTSNGVRIKTWASPFTLKASNFVYEDIVVYNVDHPIIIDQEYCPQPPCNIKVASNVQVSNVTYRNIRGSGNTEIAACFKCSENKPCENIIMENIDLWRYGGKGRLSNWCSYVNGASYGNQIPPSCI